MRELPAILFSVRLLERFRASYGYQAQTLIPRQGRLHCNSHILHRPVVLYALAATGKRVDHSNQRGGYRLHVRNRCAPCCSPCPIRDRGYHPDLVVSSYHCFPAGIAICYSASVSNLLQKRLIIGDYIQKLPICCRFSAKLLSFYRDGNK